MATAQKTPSIHHPQQPSLRAARRFGGALGSRAAALPAVVLTAIVAAVLALAPALGGLGSPPAAHADVNDFEFSTYFVNYDLDRANDGTATLRTEEHLVADFPDFEQNRGIVRYIPLDYDGVPLHPQVESVTDGNGAPIPFETDEDDGFLVVAVGTDEFLLGPHSFVITYTQENVVRAFEDTGGQEFYWDTTGTGTQQPITTPLSAVVTLGDGLGDALTGNVACYYGEQGDDSECDILIATDSTVRAVTPTGVPAGGNMSIAIGFEPDTFTVPDVPSKTWWATILPGALAGLALLGLVVLFVVRLRSWKNAKGYPVIVPQYTAPQAVNVLEASDVAGTDVNRSVSALWVSLAVRGNVRIVDGVQSEKKKRSSDELAVQLLSLDGLDELEREAVDTLFGANAAPGTSVVLSDVSEGRGAKLLAVRTGIRPHIVQRGWRAKPTRGLPVLAVLAALLPGIAALVAGIVIIALGGAGIFSTVALVVGGVATVFGIWLPLQRPQVLTTSGAELRDYLKGVQVYLDLAEKDRFAFLQSVSGADRVRLDDRSEVIKLYEKLLPYAVLWGVEDSWGEALAVEYEQAGTQPGWYASQHPFSTGLLVGGLTRFSSQAVQSVTPPASASSGSFSGGSTGGGFSGGGGGGGGMGGR